MQEVLLKMKRKTGNRAGWPRIVKQQYTQQVLESDEFKGYVTLIKFEEVLHPLWSKFTDKPICLVENGSYMLQHYPFDGGYALTTFISPTKEITQWYIDIVDHVGTINGIPYFDDLYLDLIVVPTGKIIEKDIDEIEDALEKGSITKEQYDKAWATFEKLKRDIKAGNGALLRASKQHFFELIENLKVNGI